jgi:hypothetical protein
VNEYAHLQAFQFLHDTLSGSSYMGTGIIITYKPNLYLAPSRPLLHENERAFADVVEMGAEFGIVHVFDATTPHSPISAPRLT